MITKIKHFFIGGAVSGGLLAFENGYIKSLGAIVLGYLVICALERLITKLNQWAASEDKNE